MEIAEKTEFKTDYKHHYAIAIRLIVLLVMAIHLVVNKENVYFHMLGAVSLGMFWQQSMFIGHDAGHCARRQQEQDIAIGWLIGNMCNGIELLVVEHAQCASLRGEFFECDPDIQHMPILAVTRKYFDSVYSLYHERQLKFDWLAKKFVSVQHYTFYPIMAVARVKTYTRKP